MQSWAPGFVFRRTALGTKSRPSSISKAPQLPTLTARSSRSFQKSQSQHEYPPEGVFQPNSPKSHYLSKVSPELKPSAQFYRADQDSGAHSSENSSLRLAGFILTCLMYVGAFYSGKQVQLQSPSDPPFASWKSVMRPPLLCETGTQLEQVKSDERLKADHELAQTSDVKWLRVNASQRASGETVRTYAEYEAYEAFLKDPARRDNMYTPGPLSKDMRGFVKQVVFRNQVPDAPVELDYVVLVKFGPGSTGLPGVVHPGLVATLFDELLGRCANRILQKGSVVTANLEVQMANAVTGSVIVPDQWYILTPRPDMEGWGNTEFKAQVLGQLRLLGDREAVPIAHARGVFVAPKHVVTKTLPENF